MDEAWLNRPSSLPPSPSLFLVLALVLALALPIPQLDHYVQTRAIGPCVCACTLRARLMNRIAERTKMGQTAKGKSEAASGE